MPFRSFLSGTAMLVLLFLSACTEKQPNSLTPNPDTVSKTKLELLSGLWKYDYYAVYVYDSNEVYESSYSTDLTGKTLELKSDKSYSYIDPNKSSNNKNGTWQLIQDSIFLMDTSSLSIIRLEETKFQYHTPYISYIEVPGHGGGPTYPVRKLRKEFYYLKK